MGRGQTRRLCFAFVCLVPQAGPRCWYAQVRNPHGDRRISSWYLLWEQWDWCLLLERLARRSPRSPRTTLSSQGLALGIKSCHHMCMWQRQSVMAPWAVLAVFPNPRTVPLPFCLLKVCSPHSLVPAAVVVLSKMRRVFCQVPGLQPVWAGAALSAGAVGDEGSCLLEAGTSGPCKGLLMSGRSWEPALPLILVLRIPFLEVV